MPCASWWSGCARGTANGSGQTELRAALDALATHAGEAAAPSDVREDAKAEAGATTEALAPPRSDSAGLPDPVDPGTIRVAVDKVDGLVDLVGELVITQSILAQIVSRAGSDSDPLLREAVLGLGRHTREIQEHVTAIRMVPLRTLLARLPRIVRDLAARSGKQIGLVVSGEDTELDRSVIERLADPLLHLIRNALDHGVEGPQERVAAGKPAQATIRVAASQRGGRIFVDVSDDGRGLEREKILARARRGRPRRRARSRLRCGLGRGAQPRATELASRQGDQGPDRRDDRSNPARLGAGEPVRGDVRADRQLREERRGPRGGHRGRVERAGDRHRSGEPRRGADGQRRSVDGCANGGALDDRTVALGRGEPRGGAGLPVLAARRSDLPLRRGPRGRTGLRLERRPRPCALASA